MKRIIIIILSLAFNVTAHAQSALDEISFAVNEYKIVGDNPLGQAGYDALSPFVGEQYGLEGLSSAVDALERAYASAGYSFHKVNLPPQELLSGTVILEVVEFVIGKINITGNKFYDDENIRRPILGLKEGSAPNVIDVSQSIKFANTQSSKSIILRFKEGERLNTIDAQLKVTDKDPQGFFASMDNTGSAGAEARLTLGYQDNNLFNKDHAMTVTVTTAPQNTTAATQFGLNYQIPFYEQTSRLTFLLSDSESNSGTVADNNLITGKGSVFGVTYTKSILASSSLDQNVFIGLTYKLFDNKQITTTTKVLSFPLEIGYNFVYRSSNYSLSGGIRVAANTNSGHENTNENYVATGRQNATTSWQATRYNLGFDYLFGKEWLFHIDMSGQSSSDSLISGEQFGVGGSTSLRGFEERSINGDEGYAIKMELWLPAFLPFDIRSLVFVDKSHIELKETNELFNDGLDEDLASIGVGFRWAWKQQLSVNVDVGKVTQEGGPDTSINRDGDTRTHVGLVYRF